MNTYIFIMSKAITTMIYLLLGSAIVGFITFIANNATL
jgi:hypothetical protein